MKTLRLVLGDQLNARHSWFQVISDDVVYVMMEMRQETDYAHHHVQKVIAFFLAMRHFANERRADGHQVIYLNLDDPANTQSLTQNLQRLITDHQRSGTPISRFEYLLPDEYRLDQQLKTFADELTMPTQAVDTEHFYTTRDELGNAYTGKRFVMEFFYRALRKKHDVLMDGGEPVTGRWNYDEENRNPLPKNLPVLPPKLYKREIRDVHDMLVKQGVQTIGTVDTGHFIWPVTRGEYLEMIQFFCENCLPVFGTYQDAMSTNAWSLYHSRLSFGMNSKLISPKEVVDAAIDYYLNHQDEQPGWVSYAQIEGFVRQILGWREYMRGIYWAKMPEFAQMNHFEHQAKLPAFYWDGNTKANCLHHAIGHSLDYAYSHHIQRLMITGNFALLAGIHPDEVDAWYLGVYIDAIEWVEITNTRGMSQHADGGIVGTKPYVSSAAYVNKMSNFCKSCHYDKDKKIASPAGDEAKKKAGASRPPCPFNSLYWDFYDRHRAKLERNPRIGVAYTTWDRMAPDVKAATLKQAQWYKEHLDEI
ncbi:MAG: cryptochrome/photolyase family protein [Bacteroidetes bacterium]|nr:cryptochrome/photolyase family protein [Fibrella sp.]